MSVIVRDDGFHRDTWQIDGGSFIDLEDFSGDFIKTNSKNVGIDIPVDVDFNLLTHLFDRVGMIRIPFLVFGDGRGFSIARKLRQMGYHGKLRAVGHVIADQYAHARDCGIDEVEIDRALALRQPEQQWLARLPNVQNSYQHKLLQTSDIPMA